MFYALRAPVVLEFKWSKKVCALGEPFAVRGGEYHHRELDRRLPGAKDGGRPQDGRAASVPGRALLPGWTIPGRNEPHALARTPACLFHGEAHRDARRKG